MQQSEEEWTAMKAKEEANFFLEEHMAYLDWLMKKSKATICSSFNCRIFIGEQGIVLTCWTLVQA